MLMVIFGAGASYDSSPEFPPPSHQAARQNFGTSVSLADVREVWRPPLASDLFFDANDKFGSIVNEYPKLWGILPFLRRPQTGRTVEQQLESYLDESSADPERSRQLFSVRYYLHDLLRMVSDEWFKLTHGVTNYAVLIEQIRHLNTPNEPVCLVSFNCDTLLDRAVFPSGFNQPVERYCDGHPIFKLFKPHGSVDWSRLMAPPQGAKFVENASGQVLLNVRPRPDLRLRPAQIIEKAPEIQLSDRYVRANATSTEVYNFDWPIIPAIAIPVQTKSDGTFEWPDSHRGYFHQLLSQVTKILIIGWQAKEAHFTKLLRENLPTGGITQITHLQVVGKDSKEANDIAERFVKQIDRHIKKSHNGGGFSSFVQQGLVEFLFNY